MSRRRATLAVHKQDPNLDGTGFGNRCQRKKMLTSGRISTIRKRLKEEVMIVSLGGRTERRQAAAPLRGREGRQSPAYHIRPRFRMRDVAKQFKFVVIYEGHAPDEARDLAGENRMETCAYSPAISTTTAERIRTSVEGGRRR